MNSFIKKLLIIAVITDMIWATLMATFGIYLIAAVSDAPDGGAVVFNIATALAWLTMFLVGLFQGAIFIGIACVFVVVIAMLIGAFKPKTNSN